MKKNELLHLNCAICKKSFPSNKIIASALIRKEILDEIRKTLPSWSSEMYI